MLYKLKKLIYIEFMNKAGTVLNLKIPNKVRSDLTPEFISKRIPEILGEKQYHDFKENYYKFIFKYYMTEVGFPIRDVYPNHTNHNKLSIGDVIVIDEVANYSRLYQRVPNQYGFLILEQVADTLSNSELIIWKTKINNYPQTIEKVGNYEYEGEIIMGLNTLKNNDIHLYNHFERFLNNQKFFYIDNLLELLPIDKSEVIKKYNPNWDGMVDLLWSEFILFVQDL